MTPAQRPNQAADRPPADQPSSIQPSLDRPSSGRPASHASDLRAPGLRAPGLPAPIRSDTRKLLKTGISIFVTGVISAALAIWVFGGIGRQGPHTNSGWLCLMLAMGCLPTGTLTLALAISKVVGDRKRND